MRKVNLKQLDRWQWSTIVLSIILVMAFSVFVYRYEPFRSGFEITDQLGGNVFPATILSTATTDGDLIVPADSDYIGNPKSGIAIRIKTAMPIVNCVLKWLKLLSSLNLFPNLFCLSPVRNILFSPTSFGTIRLCVTIIRQCPLVYLSRRNLTEKNASAIENHFYAEYQ